MSDVPTENNQGVQDENVISNEPDIVYKENDEDHQIDEYQHEAQDELYKSILHQESTNSVVKSEVINEKYYKNRDKNPTMSRSNMKRSVSLKPSLQYSVINEFKYIGEQVKVGKFDPNTRSFNENIFQKYYQKRLAESEKKKNRPSSALSQKSAINPALVFTNDLKHKGTQFRHGQYISTIDLTKTNGKTVCTAASLTNEVTFEERFQKVFTPRLEKLMPKQQAKTLSYFELKELHERLTVNRR